MTKVVLTVFKGLFTQKMFSNQSIAVHVHGIRPVFSCRSI